MSERTSKNPGIADYVVARRKHKDCFLDEIDRLIDWKPLEKLLRKKLQRVVNAVGNRAYPPLSMFKILLLQRWYNLSDVAAEESLYDRLSFVRFVGLSLDHDEVPDSSTICRFRQNLLEKNKTTDGGATWVQLQSTTTSDFHYVNRIAVSPNDHNRVYAATRTGLWASGDAGVTWGRLYDASAVNGVTDLVVRTDTNPDQPGCRGWRAHVAHARSTGPR